VGVREKVGERRRVKKSERGREGAKEKTFVLKTDAKML
jgi:hypothetical protein